MLCFCRCWWPLGLWLKPPSFFDSQTRPDSLEACNDESCWAAALADCSPAEYRTAINIDIASADTSMEVWGLRGGSCVTYNRTEQLFAFNQQIPEGTGMETICVYKNAADVAMEWEVIMGRREGIFGGEGGMIDPQTGIGRNFKVIDGREIAVCDVYMPAAVGQ
ncbi:hypothetical protein NDI52_05845 [Leptolyngbya sp. PL-A3]|uniref:hypothetical protein n=1 Tax=Leptolyngbya sp. PL-A3 TaxID=2933911 RepID=UPI0032985F05